MMTEPAFFGHENFLKSVRILSKNSKNSRYSRNNQNLNFRQVTQQVSNILEFKKKKEIKTNSQKSRASYYNPSAGRFVSKDPIGLKGNDDNLFRYTQNNPIMFKDPSGRIVHIAIGALLGSFTSATLAYMTGGDPGKAFISGFIGGGAAAAFGPAGAVIINSALDLFNQFREREECEEFNPSFLSAGISGFIGLLGSTGGNQIAKVAAKEGLKKGLTGTALRGYIRSKMSLFSSAIVGIGETLKGLGKYVGL